MSIYSRSSGVFCIASTAGKTTHETYGSNRIRFEPRKKRLFSSWYVTWHLTWLFSWSAVFFVWFFRIYLIEMLADLRDRLQDGPWNIQLESRKRQGSRRGCSAPCFFSEILYILEILEGVLERQHHRQDKVLNIGLESRKIGLFTWSASSLCEIYNTLEIFEGLASLATRVPPAKWFAKCTAWITENRARFVSVGLFWRDIYYCKMCWRVSCVDNTACKMNCKLYGSNHER